MKEIFSVTLTTSVKNKVTGKKESVKVPMSKDLLDYTLAKKLATIIPCTVEEAEKKLRMNKITALEKNSLLTVGMIVRNHPLEFKLEGEMIYHAR